MIPFQGCQVCWSNVLQTNRENTSMSQFRRSMRAFELSAGIWPFGVVVHSEIRL